LWKLGVREYHCCDRGRISSPIR